MPRLNAVATKRVQEMTMAQRIDEASTRAASCGWAARRLVELNATQGPVVIFASNKKQYPCGAYVAPSIHQYREAWCALAVRNARLVLGLERVLLGKHFAATWNG